MPDFPNFTLQVPFLGNVWSVGAAFQAHLVIVSAIIGMAILAPIAEYLGGRPGGDNWAWLARLLGATIVRFFAFGATWAVFALILLFGLYPRLFGILTAVFFWPLVFVGGLWLVMSISAYLYAETWDRLSDRRGLHLAMGSVFAAATFVFVTAITGLSSYQLTPPPDAPGQVPYANASWLAEAVHRHVGNLSYVGFILAGYAAVRVLCSREGTEDRARYDWLGHMGILLGVGLALVQPIVGWLYANQVRIGAPGAYQLMMIGANSWLFLIQSFLVGVVLFLGNYYLVAARRRGESDGRGEDRGWGRLSLWLIALLVLLGIIPKEWPLGQMSPWKYISLAGLLILSVVNLAGYMSRRNGFAWGRVGRGSQMALAVLSIIIVALMVTMGVIRTSARGPDSIYQRLGPSQSQEIVVP